MFTQWLLQRQLEQGYSIRDVASFAGVSETELQFLMSNGQCLRSAREQLERSLAGAGMGIGRQTMPMTRGA